ncbi:methionyl-tRNA formyltransferase [Sphingomonas parva]|uniref:Methionyl-tRNA formyltransferase n=1 Tax=Sphingomonas parva TaxID=2555898 RepID=A0A4Y8ZRU7_9SPHN|nr:methionyl-tRNA formyltransferase [Sphingomonas parva]TFI58197.1 methionyl-tRNA formyltransferase [Sphingomonas parva]
MRIAFMGTPDFAVPTLDALLAAGHEVVAVYSQPPRPAGRGKALRPSPVQQRAEDAGIEVRTPLTLRDAEAQAAFAALDLDAAVVAAYGLILPQPILDAPRRGCLNVHGSLLPRWRGAAPVQRAILAGDALTGVTIMQMERGLDTGPMLATVETPVGRKTAGALTEELATRGAALMVETLARLDAIVPVPQPEEGVTYAAKIGKEEARLDFAHSAADVERQVRAFAPAPGAFFLFGGERIKVHAAEIGTLSGTPGTVLDHGLAIACATGSIVPTLVQRAGRAPMTPAELLRGFVVPAGATLG